MTFHIETERLILRELRPEDAAAMFELDSNAQVHRYLGNNPIHSLEQAEKIIALVRQQYADHGIGRWAAIEKSSGDFIGWSGLKFITSIENKRTHFYDVGYRLLPQHWGKGYATESAKTALKYGFETLQLEEIIGSAHEENKASRRALEKCGLTFVEQYTWQNLICDWLKISKEEWKKQQQVISNP